MFHKTNKYFKRMQEGSSAYKMGRSGRTPSRGLQSYGHQECKDYARGKRDRERLRRKRVRKSRRDDVIVAVLIVPVAIIAFLGAILLRISPWIALALVIKLIFFGGF